MVMLVNAADLDKPLVGPMTKRSAGLISGLRLLVTEGKGKGNPTYALDVTEADTKLTPKRGKPGYFDWHVTIKDTAQSEMTEHEAAIACARYSDVTNRLHRWVSSAKGDDVVTHFNKL